jgi:hypothetical protein
MGVLPVWVFENSFTSRPLGMDIGSAQNMKSTSSLDMNNTLPLSGCNVSWRCGPLATINNLYLCSMTGKWIKPASEYPATQLVAALQLRGPF